MDFLSAATTNGLDFLDNPYINTDRRKCRADQQTVADERAHIESEEQQLVQRQQQIIKERQEADEKWDREIAECIALEQRMQK